MGGTELLSLENHWLRSIKLSESLGSFDISNSNSVSGMRCGMGRWPY